MSQGTKSMRKKVGKRKLPALSAKASGDLLYRGCVLNDALHALPTGDTTYFPKGVYRYRDFEEANRHWDDCLIDGMAKKANVK
jgi:hypothetical protein